MAKIMAHAEAPMDSTVGPGTKYVVVTPVRDEEEFIALTIEMHAAAIPSTGRMGHCE